MKIRGLDKSKSNKYPRIKIDTDIIKSNTDNIISKFDGELVGVTKGVCGDIEIAKKMIEGGITTLGDSRIENIKKLKENLDVNLMLLRTPMLSEIKEVVKYADISLNTEFEVLKSISKEAVKQKVQHKTIIMVDVGDRREGVMPENVIPFFEKIKNLKNLRILGIGTNVGCFGGILPTFENTNLLVDLTKKVQIKLDLDLSVISGGSTVTLKLMENNKLPKEINQLRIGEGILLGTSVSQNREIPYLNQNAFEIEAEIIEFKEKPSKPKGKVGHDAFGGEPKFNDKGRKKRAILAIGKQDTSPMSLRPLRNNVKILGASSDHTIVDVNEVNEDIKVGNTLSFRPDYSGLLKSFTSKYVFKEYLL
ncbi:MAG: alanine/ornithine racemase family PLP-dependent enzyme [Thermoplasmatota archaeon]